MTPFFASADRILRLQLSAAIWIGTPFRANSAAPGVGGGVDCLRLVEELYAATEATPRFRFPRRPMDTGTHVDRSIMLEYLRGEVADDPQSALLASIFVEQDKDEPEVAGDLIVARIGKSAFHLAVAVFCHAGDVVHCLAPKVAYGNLADSTFADRLEAVFRPVAKS